MKKLLALFLLAALTVGAIGLTASAGSAPAVGPTAPAVGSGFAAVANDVVLIKSGLRGQKMVFCDADFKQALALVDFEKIKLTEIPPSTEGTLLLSGRRIGIGQSIRRKNLASLVFVPASADVTESHFRFTVPGYAGGSDILCTMKLLDKVNYAPKATGIRAQTASTQAGIALCGRLGGSDPEGDALKYIVVSYPAHGTLKTEGDVYRYTPEAKYTGKDSFIYVVMDEYGNYSETCTAKLTVTKRESDVEYVDMQGRADYGAAVAMTARGIMNGTMLGDDLYFNPEKTVTRAEFVAMALKTVGIRADSTVGATFFDDDGDIPASLRGYVATAQKCGIVVGSFKDGALLFRPNDAITLTEAATVLAKLCGDKAGDEAVGSQISDIPVWARSSVSAMLTLGIFDSFGGQENSAQKVTRGATSTYLYRLADVIRSSK